MIEIDAGPYISGGFGDPPIATSELLPAREFSPERTIEVGAFAIDRTEVSNSAFQQFTNKVQSSVIRPPPYPETPSLEKAAGPKYPVASITWAEARAYCRFLGKNLPSDEEWEKAMRGGLQVHNHPNPNPRRTTPWGTISASPANLKDTGGDQPTEVGANPDDVSPYDVLDLAGNVQEWTRTLEDENFYGVRGCGWYVCTSDILRSVLAVPNMRESTFKGFDLGFRCVVD